MSIVIIMIIWKENKKEKYPCTAIFSLMKGLNQNMNEVVYDFSFYDKSKIVFIYTSDYDILPKDQKIQPYLIYRNVVIYKKKGNYYFPELEEGDCMYLDFN